MHGPPGDLPSGEILGRLFTHSPFPTLLVELASRRIEGASRAFASLVGRDTAELRGATFDALLPPDEETLASCLDAATTDGDGAPGTGRLRVQDGTEVEVEVRALRIEGGDEARVALFVRDVRDERLAERDRIRLQAQLSMAQKYEAVGRLAAGIAHDFNNLLSTIVLTTESLRDRLGPMEWGTLADLDVVAKAALQARDLTRELLAFGGRQTLEPRPVSVNRIVDDMQPLLRRSLPEDIALLVRPCAEPAGVNADPAQMQQVLLNLVANARDAMPDGGDILIQVHEVELDADFARDYVTVDPGPHVMISVTDTGAGMDQETQARIFEPFFTTRERGEGHGLGLATVYGIVKQSGGSIWVTSDPGVGTTFRIYLPRVPAGELPASVATTLPDEADTAVVGGSEHILVVEDEESVRRTTARVLRELGYHVTEAAAPAAALELYEQSRRRESAPVDAVLTDVVMPGMSGIQLAAKLREIQRDLPVIYMTGYLKGEEIEAVDGLSESVIPKPFTRSELARRIREALEATAVG